MDRPERFELPTRWFEAIRSNPLSYGRLRLGGGLSGVRTRSLRLKRTPLYLLSYQPDLSDLAFDGPAPSRRSCSSEHVVPRRRIERLFQGSKPRVLPLDERGARAFCAASAISARYSGGASRTGCQVRYVHFILSHQSSLILAPPRGIEPRSSVWRPTHRH